MSRRFSVAPVIQRRTRLSPWEWCEHYVDFGAIKSYETPYKVKFDGDLMPFYREPLESLFDPFCGEVIILKCSRAGASENVALNAIRYFTAETPGPALYVGAQQEWVERFAKERLFRGLNLAAPSATKLAEGKIVGNIVTFLDGVLAAEHAASKSVAKGFGYSLVIGDEVSTWPSYTADMLRKRLATYRYGHLCLISSPDPQQSVSSDHDPIFIEYFGNENGAGSSDQRIWMMEDKHGARFAWEIGTPDSDSGLKWDAGAKRADGTWDLQRVHDTARYMTPGGYEISNDERQSFIRSGVWQPTNSERATPGKRGYHIHALMTPFKTGDFGHVAMAMVEAIGKGAVAHRTFAYEYEARRWYGQRERVEGSKLLERRSVYVTGERMSQHKTAGAPHIGKAATVIATIDVQLDDLIFTAREWVQGGDSGLVDYGYEQRWDKVRDRIERAGTRHILIDAGYAARRTEVFDSVLRGAMRGAFVCFGRDSLYELYQLREIDPYEGTARQGRSKLWRVTWNPNQAKSALLRLMTGEDPHIWTLPQDVDNAYIRQLEAEECEDGRWLRKRRENHYLDCEAMQYVGAVAANVYYTGGLEQAASSGAYARPRRTRRVRVYNPRQRR